MREYRLGAPEQSRKLTYFAISRSLNLLPPILQNGAFSGPSDGRPTPRRMQAERYCVKPRPEERGEASRPLRSGSDISRARPPLIDAPLDRTHIGEIDMLIDKFGVTSFKIFMFYNMIIINTTF